MAADQNKEGFLLNYTYMNNEHLKWKHVSNIGLFQIKGLASLYSLGK